MTTEGFITKLVEGDGKSFGYIDDLIASSCLFSVYRS
jgi:hypothetical protein